MTESKIVNSLIQQFYASGAFKEVIPLEKLDWEEASKKAPLLPRGWYELSRVKAQDRVEFTRDFWLDRLPYHPSAHPQIYDFFEGLDDVGVVITQTKEEEMKPELVYSFMDNSSFFRGKEPAKDVDLDELKNEIGTRLPRDFLSFVRIHNGFGKLSDTGVMPIDEISSARRRVMDLVIQAPEPMPVDAGSLIPFYEAFGFQCFYTDWYPGNEMGNVYLSGIDYTISDTTDKNEWTENLAFPTFMQWLCTYLQGMNISP